jgi:ribonucleoside-diphosphate reductase alpha chain
MNEQRRKVFLDRYALRDTTGQQIETDPAQMWDRVAAAIATTETERIEFRNLLDNFRFVPGGRIRCRDEHRSYVL